MRKRLTKTIWYGSSVDSSGNPILPSANGGLDGLNYGELFLHLSNSKATLWTLSSEGKIVEITGRGSDVDMSSYLLKSIWDKAFEFRTDKQGVEYIFSKLPVVAQYGITMYAGDSIDIPSLASGLPFDNRTIWYNPSTNQIEVIGGTGGGGEGGVSNFWDLSGIPLWITMTKPTYDYTEIKGVPDLSIYATKAWVEGYGFALSTDVDVLTTALNGKVDKSYVDLNFVNLTGNQDISGIKTFKNGLKIGNSLISQTQNDVVYIDANLVVRGSIAMYAQDIVDIPSFMNSLILDSNTLKINEKGQLTVIGGTSSGVSDFWSLTNIPSWITISKPTYTYTEIQGTPDLSVYALKTSIPSLSGYATETWVNSQGFAKTSDIPSLSGYATESWVLGKGYALASDLNTLSSTVSGKADKATTLSGYGITDAYTKTNVDNLLKSYVTLDGEQTISGKKNFTTGGLFINGSQIIYDSTKKYWKLEGDLLVTGGITMYGNSVSGGSVGATTLGQLQNVGNWADSVADVDRIMYQAAGSSNWVAKSLSSIGGVSGDYLPLSGGTLSGNLVIGDDDAYHYLSIGNKNGYNLILHNSAFINGREAGLSWYYNGSVQGTIAVKTEPLFIDKNINIYNILHTGNYSSYALPLSGGELSGHLTLVNDKAIQTYDSNGSTIQLLKAYYNDIHIAPSANKSGFKTYINGYDIYFRYGSPATIGMYLNSSGRVGIGTTAPNQKLHVEGSIQINGAISGASSIVSNTTNGFFVGNRNDGLGVTDGGLLLYTYGKTPISFYASGERMRIDASTGNVGIGTTSIDYKLHVNGTLGATTIYQNGTSLANTYLPLSGGRITNTLTIDNSNVGLILHRSGQATPYIRFGQDANNEWGELGVYHDGRLVFWPWVSSQGGYNQWNTVWHSGNDGSGSGLDADLLDGKHNGELTASSCTGNAASATVIASYKKDSGEFNIIYGSRSDNTHVRRIYDNGWNLMCQNGSVNAVIATVDSNVASATKLKTARTIWGQSFDGTGNVSGDFTSNSVHIHRGNEINSYNAALTDNVALHLQYRVPGNVTLCQGGGNVGIGTTTPNQKLHVEGSIQINGAISGASSIVSNTTNGFFVGNRNDGLGVSTGGLLLYSYKATPMSFYTNGQERIHITSSGNVGIGTTEPSVKLEVNYSGISPVKIVSTSSTESSIIYKYGSAKNWVAGAYNDTFFIYSEKAGAQRFYVDSSGNGKFWGGVTMYGTSDKRLKKNIRTFKASEELMKLGGVYQFEYNDAEIERNNTYKGTHVGLIYQNVKGTILDKMCYEREDGYGALNYLDTSFISLIAAVGIEHETRIQKLERENKELRQEVERLRAS